MNEEGESKVKNVKKLLIVDDDEDIVFLFKKYLEREFFVTTAINGSEALEAAKNQKPNIILMDIRMPVMDGITAAKLIKEKDKEIVIIAVTAYSEEEERHLDNNPFDFYVRKPVSMKNLLSKIKSIS